MEPEKIKHLEFIQSTITRMNTNSFLIKGWTVAIVSAFIGLFASTKNEYFILAAVFPTLIFWLLDTFYLQHERKFRGLYNDVAGINKKEPFKIELFEMKPELYIGGRYNYSDVFKSNTIILLYFPIIVFLIAFFIKLKCC